jgi:hypothetical protein
MMGAQFEIAHANFVAYLTTEAVAIAPRCEEETLFNFLMCLTERETLVSSTKGAVDDWIEEITATALAAASKLQWPSRRLLLSPEVGEVLAPLRKFFANYGLYALILPSAAREVDIESFRAFKEMALTSETAALILLPTRPPNGIVEFLSPFSALRTLADNPISPPAVLFRSRSQLTPGIKRNQKKDSWTQRRSVDENSTFDKRTISLIVR